MGDEDITKKKKCPHYEDCKLTNDNFHKKEYYHLCKNSFNCGSKKDPVHLNRFVHPCEKEDCKDESKKHTVMYSHKKTDLLLGIFPTNSRWENNEMKQEEVKRNFQTEKFKWDKTLGNKDETGITVCSYNILADKFTPPKRYEYCKNYIKWEFRKDLLSNNIDRLDADILCLQEVEEQSYHQVLKSKSKYKTVHSNDFTLAIMFKIDKFNLSKEYQDIDIGEKKYFQFITLETINNIKIHIGNCHLIGDPKKHLEQKQQAEKICNASKKLLSKNPHPLIICGDFNTKPFSETYKAFSQSDFFKSSQNEFFKKTKSDSQEPPFTFFTDQIKETMDYIWISNDLTCNGILMNWNETKVYIPSNTFSSDHIPIGSLLFLSKKENSSLEKEKIDQEKKSENQVDNKMKKEIENVSNHKNEESNRTSPRTVEKVDRPKESMEIVEKENETVQEPDYETIQNVLMYLKDVKIIQEKEMIEIFQKVLDYQKNKK